MSAPEVTLNLVFHHALLAQRSLLNVKTELRARYAELPLTDDFHLWFETHKLAAKEEELGDYQDAATDYAKALARSANNKLISDADRFKTDLGRIRNARRLGQSEAARKDCAAWRPRLNVFHLELNDSHWGGRSVAMARWEFSCGDFAKGAVLLRQEMKRHPNSDTPYLAWEEAYRAAGRSEFADQVKQMGEKVRTAHDQAILGAILSEADRLAQEGQIVQIVK